MKACKDASFGSASKVADWTAHILPESAESVASVFDFLGVRETYNENNYFVNRDGQEDQWYGPKCKGHQRGYFAERHGKGGAPDNMRRLCCW